MDHEDHLYVVNKNVLHDDYEQIPLKRKKDNLETNLFYFTFLCCRKTCKGYSLGSKILSV
jgi:hypothetical protein